VALLAAGAVALALRGKPAEQAKADPEPPEKPAQKGAPNPNGKAQQQVADEVVLFDGTAASLAKWRSLKTGGEATWEIKDGFVVVMPGRGNIYTVEKFRDHAIHLEYWLLPNDKDGNSGVFVQGCYEVSIFDDAGKSSTFVTSGGIYGKHPPLKNASKPAGQWQTLDITFTPARGKQLPRITVVHNGEKVIDDVELADYTPPTQKSCSPTARGRSCCKTTARACGSATSACAASVPRRWRRSRAISSSPRWPHEAANSRGTDSPWRKWTARPATSYRSGAAHTGPR
jgi:hypothetical protein